MRIPSRCSDGAFLSFDKWWITGGIDNNATLNSEGTSESLPAGKSVFNADLNLPEAFDQHTMIRVNESTIIFVNGITSATDHVYLYNDLTASFTQLPSLPVSRYAPLAGNYETTDIIG